ncbi:MAG: hypothetical protein HQL94_07815 [Magnetococcales bacterium]|nr:hypothetical protein [Magnetococcales bacterium]MBF0439508.1 hypothetical protein [Magnetococcales bacterium]
MRILCLILFGVMFFWVNGALAELTDGQDDDIPPLVQMAAFLPVEAEKDGPDTTFTMVATNVPVREVLLSLAHKAHLGVDFISEVHGVITLTITTKTLHEVLDRMALQSNIRYKIQDNVLIIASRDAPQHRGIE